MRLMNPSDSGDDDVAGGLLLAAELLEHAVNIAAAGFKELLLYAPHFGDDAGSAVGVSQCW